MNLINCLPISSYKNRIFFFTVAAPGFLSVMPLSLCIEMLQSFEMLATSTETTYE